MHFLIALLITIHFTTADIIKNICRTEYFNKQCKDRKQACSFNKIVNDLCWEDKEWECPESSKMNWVLFNCCGACCAISNIKDFWRKNEVLKSEKGADFDKNVDGGKRGFFQPNFNNSPETIFLESGDTKNIQKVADEIIKKVDKSGNRQNKFPLQKVRKKPKYKTVNSSHQISSFSDLKTQFKSLTKRIDNLRSKLNAYLAVRKLVLQEPDAPKKLKAMFRPNKLVGKMIKSIEIRSDKMNKYKLVHFDLPPISNYDEPTILKLQDSVFYYVDLYDKSQHIHARFGYK